MRDWQEKAPKIPNSKCQGRINFFVLKCASEATDFFCFPL